MWDCQKQTQLTVRARLEPGESQLQVQRSDRSAMLPPYLNKKIMYDTQDQSLHHP